MRKSPDWFVRITLGALSLFAAAVLIGSAISGASATEKPCLPFNKGMAAVMAGAKQSNSKMAVVPHKKMKDFSAYMGRRGYPISGDEALIVETTDGATILFIKHGDQLCLEGMSKATNPDATPPADTPQQAHPPYEGEEHL